MIENGFSLLIILDKVDLSRHICLIQGKKYVRQYSCKKRISRKAGEEEVESMT